MSGRYGFKRTGGDEYVHLWQETFDPDDMLLPETRYLPIGNGAGEELERQILKWFPDVNGERQFVSDGPHEFTTYTIPCVAHFSSSWATAVLSKVREYRGPCPCFIDVRAAYAVVKDVYRHSDYPKIQYTVTAYGNNLILVKRDPRAPEKRSKRRAGSERKKKEKLEKEAAERKIHNERVNRQTKCKDAYAQAHTAAQEVLNAVPILTAVGTLEIERRQGGKWQYDRYPTFTVLQSAVAVYRRLVGGSGWEDLPGARRAARDTITALPLLTGPDDELHVHSVQSGPEAVEADRLALVWWTKAAKRILKRIATSVPVAVETPS